MFSLNKCLRFVTNALIRYKHTPALYNLTQPDIKRQEPEPTQEMQQQKNITKSVINEIQKEIINKNHGRLFAVVQILGKQFKVTTEDLVLVEGNWVPTIGDQIRLEKVLLIGSANFTLIGRPILSQEQAAVYATVVEKTLSYTKVHFKKQRRKQYMRMNFLRIPQTILRINDIQLNAVENTNQIQGDNQLI